ncbi:methyltransferase type 12 [Novosphingobium sp. PC22D]|uniref:class I SAM-dependent methyltransferase n=1 Tax=Novosphingobium sp. PC22D TaxID=1962403 RepID=UPI000BF1E2AC|nr:class I SAM-dependent methyltransferase [Novosphingobium sp. PC22D]PEQ11383.1 methyltransferase type 12 [Novosphingobium sp. PC22D]
MLNTFQQGEHALLPRATHDERARQNFAKGLRGYIQREVLPGLTPLFSGVSAKARAKGDELATRHDVRKAMRREPYFQSYAGLNRTAQELLWLSVIDAIEHDWNRLSAEVEARAGQGGELRIPENFDVPRYVTALDIHCMPGGYASAADPAQFAAGALYERGVYLYAMGYGGPFNDGKGRSVCNYLLKHLPGFEPARILDMGCSVGHSTLPYEEAYPDAEIWGIDVGAPLVRYAHARAAELGSKVNFAQMNAEHTDFEDGSFDLVVSHIMLHETSGKAMPKIFEECFRLLRPGGWMVHCDLPPFDLMDPLTQFILDNETYYNNEPFWGAMREIDQVSLAKKAGFEADTVRFDTAPMVIQAYADESAKGYDKDAASAVADREFKAGEYAPGGGWEVLIARKGA